MRTTPPLGTGGDRGDFITDQLGTGPDFLGDIVDWVAQGQQSSPLGLWHPQGGRATPWTRRGSQKGPMPLDNVT